MSEFDRWRDDYNSSRQHSPMLTDEELHELFWDMILPEFAAIENDEKWEASFACKN